MQEIFRLILNTLQNISIWAIIDILVVAYIFYKGYILFKETRAEQLLKGIALIIILIPISYILKLDMLYFLLNKTLTIGVLSFIIIFQPEIRRALEHIGRTAFEELHGIEDDEQRGIVVNEIVTAIDNLSQEKTGALLVLEQSTGLGEIVASGTLIDANITSHLLENIFVVNTPLHDGATIIRKDRIYASGCVLPLTNNISIDKKLGTRHRAAIGLSENSDAIVIIVSEETGTISLAINGKLTRNYDKEKLRVILLKVMEHTQKMKVKSVGEKVKLWIKETKKKN